MSLRHIETAIPAHGAAFLTRLWMEPVADVRLWRIVRPLVFRSIIAGRITVPRGFICDGNSLPRLAWMVSPPTEFMAAGVLHDYLYATGALSRAQADEVYREALVALGMPRWRAQLRYAAVRLFGRSAYRP